MKKFLVAAFALFTFAAAYIAAPFVTVWSVREAIRNGDAAYLDEKMEWPTVRASLRESLTDYAIGPTPVALPGQPVEQPGFWKRVKNGLSRRAVDNMVESYVTPEGLPQLFGMRQFYRENISSEANAAPLPWHQRAYGFWSRIKRAVFHSPGIRSRDRGSQRPDAPLHRPPEAARRRLESHRAARAHGGPGRKPGLATPVATYASIRFSAAVSRAMRSAASVMRSRLSSTTCSGDFATLASLPSQAAALP